MCVFYNRYSRDEMKDELSKLSGITDQQSLEKIASKTKYGDVCATAWEKITDFDPEFLKAATNKSTRS